jgi:hypothetical protein
MAEIISTLADISMIWLVFLGFIMCLIPLVIFGGMAYGMRKLLIALPPILKQGQDGMARIARETDRVSDRIASPFITATTYADQVKGTARGLSNIGRRRK